AGSGRSRLRDLSRIAGSRPRRPRGPALCALAIANHLKQDIVFEPPSIEPAECLESLARASISSIDEDLGSLSQQRQLGFTYLLKVNLGTWGREISRLLMVEPAACSEPLDTDKEWIARES